MINVVLPIKGKDIAHFHEPQNSPESPLDRYHRCWLHYLENYIVGVVCVQWVPTVFRQNSSHFRFFRLANFHPTVFRLFTDSLMSSDVFPTIFRLANFHPTVFRLADLFPTVFSVGGKCWVLLGFHTSFLLWDFRCLQTLQCTYICPNRYIAAEPPTHEFLFQYLHGHFSIFVCISVFFPVPLKTLFIIEIGGWMNEWIKMTND